MERINFFRRKYPKFVYKGYSYKLANHDLMINFDFRVKPGIRFRPEIIIKNVPKQKLFLDNFVFHLGLMEIPSYWKATCSPEIVIEAGYLNKEQLKWWKNLIIKGMGQFFYENKIDWRKPAFLKIISRCRKPAVAGNLYRPKNLENRYLVPLEGGRDSIVTMEKLKRQGKKINAFVVNPSQVTKDVLKEAVIKKPVVVERKIDPVLLKLNKKGYLNGHTPFTAVLSFLSVFCAVLFGYKNVVFSNEKSADEGNVKYLGRVINHQWAKSSEFEKMFKNYIKKYLIKNVNYFSFLRKYNELQISKMFLRYPKYFPVFSSCNARRKIKPSVKNRWCGQCPKCLFVYLTFYPYLSKKHLLKIFGRDLFEDKKLLPIMESLIGEGSQKPFECVGTLKESRLAFKLSFKKAKKNGKIPFLLTKFKIGDIIQYQKRGGKNKSIKRRNNARNAGAV